VNDTTWKDHPEKITPKKINSNQTTALDEGREPVFY